MYKKLILISLFFVISSSCALCEDNYVSPENYAINEADLTDYMDVPAPRNYKNSRPKKQKEYKYKEPSKLEESVKGKLREIRYNAQEPHHGELHEIKVNSKYKQENLQKHEEEVTLED